MGQLPHQQNCDHPLKPPRFKHAGMSEPATPRRGRTLRFAFALYHAPAKRHTGAKRSAEPVSTKCRSKTQRERCVPGVRRHSVGGDIGLQSHSIRNSVVPWCLGWETEGVTISVVPARLDWLTALAESDGVFVERFGVPAEPGWIGFPDALSFAIEAASERDADPWGPHSIFDDDGTLVGFGGFKGPPSAGCVEIGYAVAPTRRGRGIATEATLRMLDRARDAGVEVVVAHTLAEVNASTAVLERCGFVHVDTTADPDGDVAEDVYRWERP